MTRRGLEGNAEQAAAEPRGLRRSAGSASGSRHRHGQRTDGVTLRRSVSGIQLRLLGDADVLQDRHELLAETPAGVLGLPDVDDAEAGPPLARDVDEETLDRPVSRLLQATSAAGEPADRPPRTAPA